MAEKHLKLKTFFLLRFSVRSVMGIANHIIIVTNKISKKVKMLEVIALAIILTLYNF